MAKFEVCECGKHGRIVLTNGYKGPEVCSKDMGLHLVRTAIQHERMDDAEAASVMEEIQACPMPATLDEASPDLLWMAEVFNHVGIEHEEDVQAWDGQIIHALLHQPVQKGAAPKDILETARKLAQSSLT